MKSYPVPVRNKVRISLYPLKYDTVQLTKWEALLLFWSFANIKAKNMVQL